MCSRPTSTDARRREAGFTLVELMIGVIIGLVASLAVTHVLVNSESQKRAVTSGSDAQVNGALALDTVQRALAPAGYGFAANPVVLGCTLQAKYNKAAIAGFPGVLAPVVITNGATDAPDTIRILASGKRSPAVPLRLETAYPAGGLTLIPSSVLGIDGPQTGSGGAVLGPGDLMVIADGTAKACQVFQVTADPAATIPRANDDTGWNETGFPNLAYPQGSQLVNMGQPVDITYSVVSNSLRMQMLRIANNGAPSYDAAPVEVYPGIVNMQALYGKDNDANGTVDVWDNATPTTNADWVKVVAVRIAIVARSGQYEKEDVTTADLSWNLGSAVPVTDGTACGSDKCIKLKVSGLTDWKRYRYKIFETTVPLRNMLWKS